MPIRQARTGNPEAWDILFHRYQLPLYVYAFELVHDEQTSLDIVQETFVSAVKYLGSLQRDEKFSSWLFSIAHQKCIQQWRRTTRDRGTDHEDLQPETEYESSPAELLLRKEQEGEFMELIAQLPLPQRSVLLLHYVEDFSLEEIAAITESQLGTVKSRLHYARKSLRKLLEERT